MKKTYLSLIYLLLPAIITLVVDRITKNWVMHRLVVGESKALIGHIMFITHIHNEGGAFGLFSKFRIFFIIMGILVPLLILLFFNILQKRGTPWVVAAGLIFGGATGNLIDRISYRHVIDFLDFRIKNDNVWPVFNVADISITIGIAILFISILKDSREDTETNSGNSREENKKIKEPEDIKEPRET